MTHARLQCPTAVLAVLGLTSILASGCGGETTGPSSSGNAGALSSLTREPTATFALHVAPTASPITSVECKLAKEGTADPGFSNCGWNAGATELRKTYENLTDGTYTFTARATTQRGSPTEFYTYRWTVDRTAPTLRISSKPGDSSFESPVTFQFEASDANVMAIKCTLDGKDLPCTSGAPLPVPVGDGEHTFKVTVTDRIGHEVSESHTWSSYCTSSRLFVNATRPNDDGPGTSEASAFKTITKALSVATSPKTVKVLPGTYDAANGETFPINIPDGVCLLGDVPNRGQGSTATLLQGQGPHPSLLAVNVLPGQNSVIAGFDIISANPPNYSTTGVGLAKTGSVVHSNRIRALGGVGNSSGTGISLIANSDNAVIVGNHITEQYDGIGYYGGGRGGKAELNVLTNNRYGLGIGAGGAHDLGGGPARSKGGNQIFCNTANDVYAEYAGDIYLNNNQWDHVPPTVEQTTGGTSNQGIDLFIFRSTPVVFRLDGATRVSTPCN
jgi:hypothetical protein